MVEVLIPKPIGETYHHVYMREGKFCENHETPWDNYGMCDCAICEICGRKATVTNYSVEDFMKDETLRRQLVI